MNIMSKFVFGFGLLGLCLSFFFGLFNGVSFFSILLTSLICSLLASALGGGVYKVLAANAPEVLHIFDLKDIEIGNEDLDDSYRDDDHSFSDSDDQDDQSVLDVEADTENVDTYEPIESGKNLSHPLASKEYGDHVLVDNMKIQNEPKLMAEAVRTMLIRDKSNPRSGVV